MIFEKLNKENLEEYLILAKEIFPKEFADISTLMKQYINSNKEFLEYNDKYGCILIEYYLVKYLDYMGITGLYAYKHDKENECWLGWFGVYPLFRGKGYGKNILLQTLNLAKTKGYTRLNLWTDDSAVDFYKHLNLKEFKDDRYKYCFYMD